MSHATRIELERVAGDCIRFEFITQAVDKITTAVRLFYFPQPTERILQRYSSNSFMTDFYPIDTNWWIRICVYDLPYQ